MCRFDDDRLVEISGITWSRRHPGTYWVHNDSGGGPYLYAIDGTKRGDITETGRLWHYDTIRRSISTAAHSRRARRWRSRRASGSS